MHTQGKVMGHYVKERDVVHSECGASHTVRNRYFDSMLLEWPDMAQDQAFHLQNIRHHIAEMHGFGTVCGLRVESTDCHEQIRVKKGIAVDCLGREIRVECDVVLDLHEHVEAALAKRRKTKRESSHGSSPEQRASREQEHSGHGGGHDHHDRDDDDDDDDCKDDPVDLYISICYREFEERPVQAIGGPETCCRPSCENSRVRHGWCLEVTSEPPKQPPRIEDLHEGLHKCNGDFGKWLCEWVTSCCWQCEPDPCGRDHKCVGLAHVRVIPKRAVEPDWIDNCCVRPIVVPTVVIAALAQYAASRAGRNQ